MIWCWCKSLFQKPSGEVRGDHCEGGEVRFIMAHVPRKERPAGDGGMSADGEIGKSAGAGSAGCAVATIGLAGKDSASWRQGFSDNTKFVEEAIHLFEAVEADRKIRRRR